MENKNNKTMSNPVLDEHVAVFTNKEDFYGYVEERQKNSRWLPTVVGKDLTFEPIDTGFTAALDKHADYGASVEAYKDTVARTRLAVVTPDGEKHLVRVNALNQAKQRLCIDGAVFNSFSPEQTALVLNTCCSVNGKDTLLRVADEKLTSWLSAKSYAIIESDDVYRETEIALKAKLGRTELKKGFYSHTFMDACYSIKDSAPGLKDTLNRYRQIIGEEYELMCSVRTSDSGNCAITVDPRMVHVQRKAVSVPLGAAMRVQHKGTKTMETLHEMFDMLDGALTKGVEKMEQLSKINIHNAPQALMRALKKVQAPANLSMDVVEKWRMIHGDESSTALALYLAAQEVALRVALEENDLLKTYRMEDALARMLGIRWKDLDYPGDLSWS